MNRETFTVMLLPGTGEYVVRSSDLGVVCGPMSEPAARAWAAWYRATHTEYPKRIGTVHGE